MHHHVACTISRHRTSEGVVVYRRCACGALQVRLDRSGQPDVVVSESPHGDVALDYGVASSTVSRLRS